MWHVGRVGQGKTAACDDDREPSEPVSRSHSTGTSMGGGLGLEILIIFRSNGRARSVVTLPPIVLVSIVVVCYRYYQLASTRITFADDY